MDSEDERQDADKKRMYSEFLGGGGESDCDEQEDTEGDLTVRRQALKKCSLDECEAMFGRSKKVERANAPDRTKEADAQMKGYVFACQSLLEKPCPLYRHTMLHRNLLCCSMTLPVSSVHRPQRCEGSNPMTLKTMQTLIQTTCCNFEPGARLKTMNSA